MELGLMLTDIPASVPASQHFDDILRLADAAQRNGLTHIALGQHFVYGDLRWLQPVPLLARLAGELDPHVKLVTNIMIGPLYHPILLAEELATLDIVSGGRLRFGVGLGYRPDEFAAFQIPTKERAPRLDELLVLLKELWTAEEVHFDGRFWQLDGVRPHLQPIQQPSIPIWVGGVALAGARRAGRLGDAYIANPEAEPHELAARYTIVKEEFAVRGKPFTSQPLRRNIRVAATAEQARAEYVAAARPRYQAYGDRGLDLATAATSGETREFAETSERHAIIGTPDDCVAQLLHYARTLPVDPLLLKAQWSYTGVDDAVAQLDWWGKELVPAVTDVDPTNEILGPFEPHTDTARSAS